MNAKSIHHIAVIGAGTMGSQIAILIANANIPVLMLDIVLETAKDRNILANQAIEKIKKGTGLFNQANAKNLRAGNIEDDLDLLRTVDWVIECVPEQIEIKRQIYKKIESKIQKHAIVSSNTSTIPLSKLKEGFSEEFKKQLCITHFFNPPTIMPLLELVTDQDNNKEAVDYLKEFADKILGKNIVHAKDTAGFIGNRIGIYWILCAMEEAERESISIPTADSIMNGSFGFPKTGIFGLADLIGLKIIPDIISSMCEYLNKEDDFYTMKAGLNLIEDRLKAQAGFYIKTENGEKKAINLKNSQYEEIKESHIKIGSDWQKFLGMDMPESRFAKATLIRMLNYTAMIAASIADNILEIDSAMRDGFGWKYGPFQMIDQLTSEWILKHTVSNVPPLLKQAQEDGFYRNNLNGASYLDFSGKYQQRTYEEDKWTLALKTFGKKPILENDKARLWDIGDGITCFEIKTKMHVIDNDVLNLLNQAIIETEKNFVGLIIGHDDKDFSGGLDLNIVLQSAADNNWSRVEQIIKNGQDCFMRLKYAKIPSVIALSGYAVGGACEATMHCTAAQCHISTHLGLVETNIGVIPAWGGTTEHLCIATELGGDDVEAVVKHTVLAFLEIASASKSRNAKDAFTMELIKKPSNITMNRERLLPDAKALCLKLAKKFAAKIEVPIKVPMDKLYKKLHEEAAAILAKEPNATPHRKKELYLLADALSGYAAVKKINKSKNETGWYNLMQHEILATTYEAFMELVQEQESVDRIRKILGK